MAKNEASTNNTAAQPIGETLRRWAKSIPLLIALIAVWVVMNEQLNWIVFISGIAVGIIALVVTRLVLNRSYADELWLGWRAGLIFFPYLLWQIFLAALNLIKVIISGRDEYVEFNYHTTLPDDLSIFLLASSITLTPGTIVIGREGSDLTVLAVGSSVADAEGGCATLERHIARLKHPFFGGGNRSGAKAARLEGGNDGLS